MDNVDFRLSEFVPNSPGIMEVFKSAGMQAALRNVTSPRLTMANAAARKHFHHGVSANAPYRGDVVVLDRSAIGQIEPNTRIGWIDQARHHTLDSLNH